MKIPARAAALLLVLALLSGCSSGGTPTEEERPVYSPTGQDNPNVDQNPYDLDCFVQVDGFTVYRGEAPSYVGVDVSSYQQEIDWTQVAAAGVSFAMIRVGYRGYTYGTLNQDPCFEANIQGALAAGLDVGVYFFSQAVSAEEAQEEALQVLEWVEGYPITYPVAFDWEPVEGEDVRTDGVTSETVTQCVRAFCSVIAEAGYTPMVYFNRGQGYAVMDLEQLQEYSFWLASYTDVPDYAYHFEMWQYSCTGSVPGIQGNVDLDLCLTEYAPEEDAP